MLTFGTPFSGTSSVTTEFNTIEEALTAIRNGEMVVVVDDDDRENEGDLIMAASKATSEAVAFMIRHTSGLSLIHI